MHKIQGSLCSLEKFKSCLSFHFPTTSFRRNSLQLVGEAFRQARRSGSGAENSWCRVLRYGMFMDLSRY